LSGRAPAFCFKKINSTQIILEENNLYAAWQTFASAKVCNSDKLHLAGAQEQIQICNGFTKAQELTKIGTGIAGIAGCDSTLSV